MILLFTYGYFVSSLLISWHKADIVVIFFFTIVHFDIISSLSVSWNKGDRKIEDTGRFKFGADDKTFSFEIPAALSTDTGSYSVVAKNGAGSSSWTFSLGVAMGEAGGDVDVQELLKSVQVGC